MLIKQNEPTAAKRTVYFTAVNTSDDSAHTSTISAADIKLSKAGGAEAAVTNNAVHIATGLHKLELTATEVNTVGEASIRLNKTGVYNDVRIINVVAFDPYAVSDLGLLNLDTAVSSRSSLTEASLLDLTDGVETGLTLRQALRGIAAMLFGKVSGAGSGKEVFRSAVDTRDALTITNDTAGNRTSVTRNL